MADADDEMVRRLEAYFKKQEAEAAERRLAQAERRVERKPVPVERRVTCTYCFQPGDHQNAAQCLRALERAHAKKKP